VCKDFYLPATAGAGWRQRRRHWLRKTELPGTFLMKIKTKLVGRFEGAIYSPKSKGTLFIISKKNNVVIRPFSLFYAR
jgi:hypothetical protein